MALYLVSYIVSRIASIFLILRILDVTGCSSIPLTNSSLKRKFNKFLEENKYELYLYKLYEYEYKL